MIVQHQKLRKYLSKLAILPDSSSSSTFQPSFDPNPLKGAKFLIDKTVAAQILSNAILENFPKIEKRITIDNEIGSDQSTAETLRLLRSLLFPYQFVKLERNECILSTYHCSPLELVCTSLNVVFIFNSEDSKEKEREELSIPWSQIRNVSFSLEKGVAVVLLKYELRSSTALAPGLSDSWPVQVLDHIWYAEREGEEETEHVICTIDIKFERIHEAEWFCNISQTLRQLRVLIDHDKERTERIETMSLSLQKTRDQLGVVMCDLERERNKACSLEAELGKVKREMEYQL